MSDLPVPTKADLRSTMKTTLAEMSPEQRHAGSASACRRLLEIERVAHASVVMLYMPLFAEVDLTPAAVRLFQAGRTVCVPRVDWRRRDMDAVEVESFGDDVMDIDEHGLRSPRQSRPILPELIDVVVVPGLAFDTQGHRLGRGGGYYDRFLGRVRPGAIAIGLAFDRQVVSRVPVNDRDVSMHMVCTDRRVVRGRGARARRGCGS